MKITSKEVSWWHIYIYVVIVYIMSHGLMLLLYGAWWDDMLLWNVPEKDLEQFMGPSNFNNPFLYFIVSSINRIEDTKNMNFVFRLVPFVCWFISVSSFFLINKKITNNKAFTLYSSLICASCGLNKCMMLISCYHYAISISLFMIGLVCFVCDYYKDTIYYRILNALSWTLSLLVWRSAVLVVPALVIIACIGKTKFRWNSTDSYAMIIKYAICKYWILILGLVTFAILYLTILAPQGTYAGYYSVDLRKMLLSPITTVLSSLSLFLGYISNLFSIFAINNTFNIIIIFFLIGLFSIFLNIFSFEKDLAYRNKFLMVACIFLLSSMMPHLLREFVCSFGINGYKSRVAALAVFPLSMIITYLIFIIKNIVVRSLVCSTFVILSFIISINTYLDYEKGWLKNEAIVCFLKENYFLKDKNVIFIDNSRIYSPFFDEDYRYYDYEGCSKVAYGKNDKTKCSEYESFKDFKRFQTADYYIYIYVNERYSYIGLRSLFYRFYNSNKRDEMKKQMLSFFVHKVI